MAIPDGWTSIEAMALGTAGLTAMQAISALRRHGIDAGKVVITGISGGLVGCSLSA